MPVALQRKKRKRMYPHHSACPPSLPSLIIETISLGLKSRLFHLFLFPQLCVPLPRPWKWKGKRRRRMSPYPILRLQPFETLMMCLFLLFSVVQRTCHVFFSWQLTIGDLVKANSRVCQLSSGLGRGGCSRTRHIYSIAPNLTGSDA